MDWVVYVGDEQVLPGASLGTDADKAVGNVRERGRVIPFTEEKRNTVPSSDHNGHWG